MISVNRVHALHFVALVTGEAKNDCVHVTTCHLPVSAALAVCGLIVTVGDGRHVSDSAPQIQL